MKELFEGPVQQWEPDDAAMAVIENLLASEDELTRAYGEAYQNGCWIREWNDSDGDPGSGLTAVGDFNTLKVIEFRTGRTVDQGQFSLMDCMDLGAYSGLGETRVERVHDGVRQVLEAAQQ